MRKLLIIFGALGLVVASSATVLACGQEIKSETKPDDNQPPVEEI